LSRDAMIRAAYVWYMSVSPSFSHARLFYREE